MLAGEAGFTAEGRPLQGPPRGRKPCASSVYHLASKFVFFSGFKGRPSTVNPASLVTKWGKKRACRFKFPQTQTQGNKTNKPKKRTCWLNGFRGLPEVVNPTSLVTLN